MAQKRSEEGWRKQGEYRKAYDKENRVKIGANLNRIYEADLIEFWEALPNKAEWLKSKLREDVEKQKAGK